MPYPGYKFTRLQELPGPDMRSGLCRQRLISDEYRHRLHRQNLHRRRLRR